MNGPVLALRSTLFLLFFTLTNAVHGNDEGIEVSGSARIEANPNMATFHFSINDRGKDLSRIKNAIDEKSKKIISLCRTLSIDLKNISSSELSIHPQYDPEHQTFVGYEVSRDISVVLMDLSLYTSLVDGAISSGITTIDSIELDTTERQNIKKKALASAVAAAREKAQILATSSNVDLGKVVSIKELESPLMSQNYLFRSNLAQESDQGAFTPGILSISVSVSVKYLIQ